MSLTGSQQGGHSSNGDEERLLHVPHPVKEADPRSWICVRVLSPGLLLRDGQVDFPGTLLRNSSVWNQQTDPCKRTRAGVTLGKGRDVRDREHTPQGPVLRECSSEFLLGMATAPDERKIND